ncbi:hypothetical protein MNBD_BACTEROID07-1568 [hydrothermal vent metagenome]|uniref:Uncharacterized protein n=1 Tax=hydrothermal vent metagenome TaxID=652676 RepID=A0A3B0ULU2_9ZZZZ
MNNCQNCFYPVLLGRFLPVCPGEDISGESTGQCFFFTFSAFKSMENDGFSVVSFIMIQQTYKNIYYKTSF